MKKKLWIIVLVIVLLCLTIPIPTGIYKDGGTRSYTALSYKIVNWNHMYDGGIYSKTKLYPFPLNFMSIDSLLSREEKNFKKAEESEPNGTHTHEAAEEPQTVSEPISGYCGNTQTTVYFDDSTSYTFMYGESVTLTDILINLDYDPKKLCKCLPEYTVETEFGTPYGINITSGYARSDAGQADLTEEQINKIKEIVLWAKEKAE